MHSSKSISKGLHCYRTWDTAPQHVLRYCGLEPVGQAPGAEALSCVWPSGWKPASVYPQAPHGAGTHPCFACLMVRHSPTNHHLPILWGTRSTPATPRPAPPPTRSEGAQAGAHAAAPVPPRPRPGHGQEDPRTLRVGRHFLCLFVSCVSGQRLSEMQAQRGRPSFPTPLAPDREEGEPSTRPRKGWDRQTDGAPRRQQPRGGRERRLCSVRAALRVQVTRRNLAKSGPLGPVSPSAGGDATCPRCRPWQVTTDKDRCAQGARKARLSTRASGRTTRGLPLRARRPSSLSPTDLSENEANFSPRSLHTRRRRCRG